MACAGLLIAAPLALFLSGGSDADGSPGARDGVFTGGPATGTEEGTGRGGAGVATGSSRSPEVGLPPMDGTANLAPGGAVADAGAAGAAGGGSDGAVGAGGAPAGGGSAPVGGGGAPVGGAAAGSGTGR